MSSDRFRRSVIAIALSAVASGTLSAGSLLGRQTSPDQTAPIAPAQRPLPPSAGHLSRSPLHFALPRSEYLCAGGARIVILIETKAARLTLNDHIYNMKQLETASGAKYAEGPVVWSSTGDEGFLEDASDPSRPRKLAEDCHLEGSYPLAASTSSSVKGTVRYGKNPALPPDAVLIVQLRDLNRDADDSAAVLAEQRIPMAGRKSPVSFAVDFDPAKIPAKVPFAVFASITGHGKLLFVLVSPVIIPDISARAPLQLALSRATSNKGKTPPSPEAPPHL
jgi:uncharacterized lipoprotein YbaY/membrane-bound inhibitor of C-type lysozyme